MIDWEASEDALVAQLRAAQKAGDIEIARLEIYIHYLRNSRHQKMEAAQRVLNIYTRYFPTIQPPVFTTQHPIARIDQVKDAVGTSKGTRR